MGASVHLFFQWLPHEVDSGTKHGACLACDSTAPSSSLSPGIDSVGLFRGLGKLGNSVVVVADLSYPHE